MSYDVVLLTEKQYIAPEKTDWYIEQVLTEDRLVLEALEAKGLTVTKKDWADPDFDWSTAKTLLFRTTWDYFHRFEEFSPWLDQVSKITTLINPAGQIRWNMDKHYLADLAAKNVPIVQSHFIPKGTAESLEEIHQELGWKETVIKPTISGAARHTYRLTPENIKEHEAILKPLIAQEDFILQPFLHQITTKGEVSHVVIGGYYSHSILKTAKEGDYRVQDDFGGSIHLYAAGPEEVEFAENTVKACDPQPLYARVDLVWDNDDQLALGELELIEPELWFRKNDKAAGKLADAIFQTYFSN